MYSATFTFAKGEYDDEFHRRDQAIADVAKSIPGYLGEEAWENPGTGMVSTVYYWDSLDPLQRLVDDPRHLAAKQLQGRWLIQPADLETLARVIAPPYQHSPTKR